MVRTQGLEVVLGFQEEGLHHVHQFHAVEDRQQDVLADPSYPGAAVQGAVRSGSPGPLRRGTDSHLSLEHSGYLFRSTLLRCYFGEEQTAVKQSVDVERDSEVRTGKEAPKSYGELARSRARSGTE